MKIKKTITIPINLVNSSKIMDLLAWALKDKRRGISMFKFFRFLIGAEVGLRRCKIESAIGLKRNQTYSLIKRIKECDLLRDKDIVDHSHFRGDFSIKDRETKKVIFIMMFLILYFRIVYNIDLEPKGVSHE